MAFCVNRLSDVSVHVEKGRNLLHTKLHFNDNALKEQQHKECERLRGDNQGEWPGWVEICSLGTCEAIMALSMASAKSTSPTCVSIRFACLSETCCSASARARCTHVTSRAKLAHNSLRFPLFRALRVCFLRRESACAKWSCNVVFIYQLTPFKWNTSLICHGNCSDCLPNCQMKGFLRVQGATLAKHGASSASLQEAPPIFLS
eukprot:4732836-Amphidinium_carterae.1